MPSDEISRVFDILQEQGRTLKDQGMLLAAIAQSQKDTNVRLEPLYDTVETHSRQIAFWRGSLAILTVLFTSAMAWAGIVIGKHR